jgi:PAS domain S-box-containing protein
LHCLFRRAMAPVHGDDGVVTIPRAASWPTDPRMLDAFDAAALVVDAEGRITFANAAANRLYGSRSRDLAGENLLSRLFPDSERLVLAEVLRRVRGGQRWRGPLEVIGADGTARSAEVTCSPIWREDAVAGLLWVLEDRDGDRHGAHDSRRLADRLARLARVTAELVMADTVEGVTKIVISHAAEVVGATIATLTLREGPDMLRLAGITGGREEDARWERYPAATRTPTSDTIRTGERLILAGGAAIAERYPELPSAARGERTVVCLPLQVSTRSIGAIGLSFPGRRRLDTAELEFFDVIADTCAQALDRISAKEEAARQTAKLTFLADASTELASSLDYQATLAKVARLAVPTFADWCAIDLIQDGRLNRLVVEHIDPAKVELARALEERYPSDPDAPGGVWTVMRTGRSELVAEITDDMLVAAAKDEEHLRLARLLNLRSALTVPLVARGKVMGVITWVSAESERLYGADDLTFAEDLGKRAAIAIDNAELHSQTLAAAVRLQQAVLPSRLPVLPGWDVASYYSPAGRTEIGGDFFDAVPLGDGRLVLFIGDVMGRGVDAAASMAQVRAAVRAYTAVDPTPHVVMGQLDRMYAQYPSEQMVTLVYMLVDPARDEVAAANAGHPAPLILRRDATPEQLPSAEGTPLGTVPQHRQQVSIPFHPGDTLLAFTDGLIERREEDIDQGQDRLRNGLSILAEVELTAALEELAGRFRDPSRDDDVAALAVRRRA